MTTQLTDSSAAASTAATIVTPAIASSAVAVAVLDLAVAALPAHFRSRPGDPTSPRIKAS